MVENLAQERGYQSSPISTPTIERTTSMALEKRNSGRSGPDSSAGEQVVVLLVRKNNEGGKPLGQHDKTSDDPECGILLSQRIRKAKAQGLSKREHFLIYRRRQGLSQRQMATMYSMERRRYSEFEAGVIDADMPSVNVLPLTAAELCFIWRRRTGETQKKLAEEVGVTRYWLMLMETGKAPSEKLEAYWNGR